MTEGWRIAFVLEQRELDGEIVAYCDETGDTFKVAPVTRVILDRVAAGAADLAALSHAVASAFGAVDGTEIATAVEETVGDLESHGIIERVSV